MLNCVHRPLHVWSLCGAYYLCRAPGRIVGCVVVEQRFNGKQSILACLKLFFESRVLIAKYFELVFLSSINTSLCQNLYEI